MKNQIKRNGYANKSAEKKTEKDRIIEQTSIIYFGERLKEAMEKQGLSHLTLSKLSGLSETTIRKYIQGKIYPGIDSAALVAHACGVSIEWLLTGKSDTTDYSPGVAEEVKPQQHDELDLILQRMHKEERLHLLDAFYNIGIKGVLQQLKQPQIQPEDAEEAIRALPIRESLKDAVCMALAGNEETDREILRGIERRARSRVAESCHTAAPETLAVKKPA